LLRIGESDNVKKTADEKDPFLQGMRLQKRFVIVYSPYDFSSSLGNRLDEDSKGIKSPSSFRLVSNIVSYGLGY